MLQGTVNPEFVSTPPAYLRRKKKDRLFFGVRLDSYAALRVSHLGQQFCSEHDVLGTPRGGISCIFLCITLAITRACRRGSSTPQSGLLRLLQVLPST